MRSTCVALTFVLAAAVLPGGSTRAADPAPVEDPILYVTKTLYLEGVDLRDAVAQIRSPLDIRCVAIIKSRGALVISDTADKVDQAVDLFRGKKTLVRVAEPHAPLNIEQLAKGPAETRVFRIEEGSMETAVAVFRAIYQVRELEKSEQEGSITVKTARPLLEASESLLGELGLLAESQRTSGSVPD